MRVEIDFSVSSLVGSESTCRQVHWYCQKSGHMILTGREKNLCVKKVSQLNDWKFYDQHFAKEVLSKRTMSPRYPDFNLAKKKAFGCNRCSPRGGHVKNPAIPLSINCRSTQHILESFRYEISCVIYKSVRQPSVLLWHSL